MNRTPDVIQVLRKRESYPCDGGGCDKRHVALYDDERHELLRYVVWLERALKRARTLKEKTRLRGIDRCA